MLVRFSVVLVVIVTGVPAVVTDDELSLSLVLATLGVTTVLISSSLVAVVTVLFTTSLVLTLSSVVTEPSLYVRVVVTVVVVVVVTGVVVVSV